MVAATIEPKPVVDDGVAYGSGHEDLAIARESEDALAITGAVHSQCRSGPIERTSLWAVERIEASRHFSVPAERAYAFITDLCNWPRFFPGLRAVDPGSRCATAGDRATVTTRLLGRERRLELTFDRFDPNRSFSYTSRQEGLPDAHHERVFTPDGNGFTFDMSITYEPRPGLPGLADRLILTTAVRRLLHRTLDALERELA